MTKQTYAERKERERRRDAIRELALEVAEHTAGGDLTRVERGGDGEVRFVGRVPDRRCSCGLTITPIPMPHSRYGMLPIWVCGVCSLQFIIETCAQLEAHVGEAS